MQILALTLLLALTFCPTPVLAGDRPPQESMPSTDFEQRPSSPAEQPTELYHTLQEKKDAGLKQQLTERLTVAGRLEAEASCATLDFGDSASDSTGDLSLVTAQLGFGMKLNEMLVGKFIFLYEEGGDLEVDEATIDLQLGAFFARVGRHYLPFGAFHSHFVSDPVTLALGETRATALQVGYKSDLLTAAGFAFNGTADKSGAEDHLDDWGARATIRPLPEMELGISYLSDLAESNAELLTAPSTRRVGAWSSFAHLERGPFTFEAEYLAAARSFAVADLDGDGDGQGDRPRAWNLECALRPAETVEIALRYEESADFAGQPERQYGAALSWSPREHTTLAFEYLRGTFDPASSGGIDSRNLFTTQLAYAF